MDWKHKAVAELARAGARIADKGSLALDTARSAGLVDRARSSQAVARGARAAKTVASNLPVRELAVMCGRAGAANAIVEGAMGGAQAVKAMRAGKIDGRQAVIHTSSEASCGFITSSVGTAGTLAAYMVTGTLGPLTIAAGMGASIGSRTLYRKVVGETLPGEDAAAGTWQKVDDSGMENIGPTPQEDDD